MLRQYRYKTILAADVAGRRQQGRLNEDASILSPLI